MMSVLIALLGLLGAMAAGSAGAGSSAGPTDIAPDVIDVPDDDDSHDDDGHTDDGTDGGHDDHTDDGTDGGHDDHTDDGTDGGHDDHTDDGTDGGHDDHTDDGTDGGHDDHTDDGTDGGHDDHTDDGTGDDHGDHGDHTDDTAFVPPTTPEEIDAFVAAVRAGTDDHTHGVGDDKMMEHMQVMDLVSPADATHIAIGHGSWFDPSNWHNGEVPGDDAKVVIPEQIWMEYDNESDDRVFTVRVDGQLEFATDVDSKIVVDTMIVSPSGTLLAGTADDPIEDGVNVDIVIANNGPIDTDWDPGLFSRGLISHGHTEIHGQEKDSHEKVIEDPMAGDTSVTFGDLPEGWQVGDKIVVAGTHYEGYNYNQIEKAVIYHEPEDEIRIISEIDGNTVHFETPLEFDHDTPRADLHTSVANYSRNVTVRTEDAEDAEISERGHVMMMHSDDVDVRYAAFDGLGRTDKSKDLFDEDGPDGIASDSNVAGRYSLHLHRTGLENQDDPAILEGNAVFGSPGWGFVHHDSHAILSNNASFDTFGAGFVAEIGNETGSWVDNIAIDAQGQSWGGAKGQNEPGSDNFGVSGDGFWFTGRMVESSDNIAASVNHGFIYFHRVASREDFDSDLFEFPEALSFNEETSVNETPILVFEDNEAFASRMGVHVVKSSPLQGHDVHSVMDGFTAWSVEDGAGLQYTAHYVLKDFDLIGKEGGGGTSDAENGIAFGKNTFDMTIVNARVDGFENGIDLTKSYSENIEAADGESHSYTVVNATLTNNEVDIAEVTSDDTIITGAVAATDKPVLDLDPLVFDGSTFMEISGTKTDSLGTHDFPNGPEDFDMRKADLFRILEENGYYAADDGNNYMIMNIYFSDSLTGDVYEQPELVLITDGIVGDDTTYNGEMSLADLVDATDNGATKVWVADDAFARTIQDFEDHASLQHMDGEMVMAALSTGELLSEAMPTEMVHDDDHDEMDM